MKKINYDSIYNEIFEFKKNFIFKNLDNDYEIFIYMSQELEKKLGIDFNILVPSFGFKSFRTFLGYSYSIDINMKGLEFKPVIQLKI